MALPDTPIVKKFFTNKIESSRTEWGDYLLEIADIFSMFDGDELDRDLLTERFSVISGRSPYALRDVSNFRDEFGAYGTYLGLFHFELQNGKWHIFLSKATKHFLCSTEPDVESFCRTQMALFQYPNGAGAAQISSGSTNIQGNVKADTIREIENYIRLNPLRLLCRTVVVMHEMNGTPLNEIVLPYQTIFMLVNDDTINRSYSPSYDKIKDALDSYEHTPAPQWVTSGKGLTNFKRNFHIMERTGLFARVQHTGLSLSTSNIEQVYSYVKTISSMTHNFEAFEPAYDSADIDSAIKLVISSPQWGIYFDALTMPMDTLTSLSDDVDIADTTFLTPPIGTVEITEQPFPELKDYQTNQVRAFSSSGNRVDPYETIIRREKANREHARILNMLAATIRANGYSPFENTFIDLYTDTTEKTYIFEVKSNNNKNVLSQIRKAIAQLYEYRYRSDKAGAILCIVLQQKPPQPWVEDYLLHDRRIMFCWLVDDVRLECPDECRETLSAVGIVE